MEFVRVIKNGDELAKVIDMPKELRNRKVEVIIFPYQDREDIKDEKRSLKGALSKYKNEALQSKEGEAWLNAVVEKYENS